MQSLAPAPSPSESVRSPIQAESQEGVSERLLREQLLSSVTTTDPSREQDEMPASSPASPNDGTAVDPTISGTGLLSASAGSDDGNENDGRKSYGRRELSTSKRAAQNRAAQRAFRQRKEGYIKKLEEQVRDYTLLSENFKVVQSENHQLRDYIISLQSRLIESQGDFPQPPPNIDGLHPANAGHQHQLPPRHMSAAAAAAGGMAGLEQVRAGVPAGVPAGRPAGFHAPAAEGGQQFHHSEDASLKRIKVDADIAPTQQPLPGRVER